MATVTRYNGNATGVPGVDVSYGGAAYTAATPVMTGIGKKITAFKINAGGSVDLTATSAQEFGVGGAVEQILSLVAQNATIIAYQGESGASSQLSVFVEGNSWTDAALQTALRLLTSAGVGPVNLNAATVASTGGLKLA